jgi:nicotinamidase-related amidase
MMTTLPETFRNTAVIAVDLQNDCVEPDGAWPIHDRDALLANCQTVLKAVRAAGLPVIYTQHWLDPFGRDALRYEPRTSGRPQHGIAGTQMAEIHPMLTPEASDLIVRKQRFSGFYGTNLDLILRQMGIDHLIMFGLWTEACFETTVWDALWRDYRISIVKDACSTASDLMHMTSILDLANWLYAGTIYQTQEFCRALANEPHRAWVFEKPSAFVYTSQNVRELYDSI